MVARVLKNPLLLLRLPKLAFHAVVGNPGYVDTPRKGLWILMRLIGRFPRVRSIGLKVSSPPDEPPERLPSSRFFAGTDTTTVVEQLHREGLAYGLDLDTGTVAQLRAFADEAKFAPDFDGDRAMTIAELEAAPSNGGGPTVGEYLDLAESELISELQRDPVLLDIAAGYLGTNPRLMATRLWWSFPGTTDERAQSVAAQLFHFDLDDFRFLKFFFYLTDVDESAGPHVVVPGTHRRRKISHSALVRRLSDAEVRSAYGDDAIESIQLEAGRGFAEDTFCIHKGQTPTGNARLLLQLEFGVNPFFAGE